MLRAKDRRAGFTIVELLVVIGIIAVLTALLLPTLTTARQMGQQAVCLANLRQLMVGAEAYKVDYKLVPITLMAPSAQLVPYKLIVPRWYEVLDPYVEGMKLYDPTVRKKVTHTQGVAPNQTLHLSTNGRKTIFTCPAARGMMPSNLYPDTVGYASGGSSDYRCNSSAGGTAYTATYPTWIYAPKREYQSPAEVWYLKDGHGYEIYLPAYETDFWQGSRHLSDTSNLAFLDGHVESGWSVSRQRTQGWSTTAAERFLFWTGWRDGGPRNVRFELPPGY